MNKNIVLVGFGYMAQRVSQKLKHSGLTSEQTVFSLSRKPSTQTSWIQHICWDLDNNSNTNFTHPEIFNYSRILYLVPPPAAGKNDPRLGNFLSLIKQSKHVPEKIVLISTTGVYGNCKGAWVDESYKVNPNVDRAYRRADAEKQLQQYCFENIISSTILRVSGIYAEDKLPLTRLKKQLPIVNQDDSPYSNRIHAEDLATICTLALLHNHAGIYNCSDNKPTTMYDYFTRLAKTYHLPTPPTIDMQQAQTQLSSGMLSYMQESRRISNKKLLAEFQLELKYPSLSSFLSTQNL